MAKIEAFENHTTQYEDWFEKNKYIYKSELLAVHKLIPPSRNGIEIGVGSGRFAVPLGIKIGVDPSRKMITLAQQRGIEVVEGIAEDLPLKDSTFGYALMITTICFVDNIKKAFQEAYRIIKKNGYLILGFVDRSSPIGQLYQKQRNKSKFYKEAQFFSVEEVVDYLKKIGFYHFIYGQTIFHPLSKIKQIEPIKNGYGVGSFVVIRAKKK